MGAMPFHWEVHDAAHDSLRTAGPFDTQELAEDWLRVKWEDLRAEGAHSVTLLNDEEIVYDMGLEPA
jgi:hypothetical protein